MTVQQTAESINASLLMSAARLSASAKRSGVTITLRDSLGLIRAAVDGMIDELERLPQAKAVN